MRCFKEFISVILNDKINYSYQIVICIIEQYKEYLIVKGYKLKSVQRKYYCLRSYLNWLNKQNRNLIEMDVIGYIQADKFKEKWKNKEEDFEILQKNLIKKHKTCGRSKKLKMIKAQKDIKSLEYLSAEQIGEIFKNLDRDTSPVALRNKALLMTLVTTGIRRSEALGLTWNGVDLVQERAHVIMRKNKKEGTLKINSELVEVFDQYKKECFFRNGNSLPNYVFSGKDPESMLSIASYNNAIEKCTKGVEVKEGFKITGHTFRHTFITNLIKANIPVKKIAEYTKISERVLGEYIHLSEGDVEVVGEAINNIYFGKNRVENVTRNKKVVFTRYSNRGATLSKVGQAKKK